MILLASLFNTPINFFKSDFAADTSKDVPADAGVINPDNSPINVEVKCYDNAGKYYWDRSVIGYQGYASTGKTSADAVASWLRNTLSATRGMGVKFLSLAPHDTAEPIDCEMFAWGSWSNWSEWSDCVDNTQTRTRTKTRSVKTAAANGGTACPTDLEQTETETQTCGETSGRSNGNGDDVINGDNGNGDNGSNGSNGDNGDDDDEESGTPWLLYGGIGLVGLVIISKMV